LEALNETGSDPKEEARLQLILAKSSYHSGKGQIAKERAVKAIAAANKAGDPDKGAEVSP